MKKIMCVFLVIVSLFLIPCQTMAENSISAESDFVELSPLTFQETPARTRKLVDGLRMYVDEENPLFMIRNCPDWGCPSTGEAYAELAIKTYYGLPEDMRNFTVIYIDEGTTFFTPQEQIDFWDDLLTITDAHNVPVVLQSECFCTNKTRDPFTQEELSSLFREHETLIGFVQVELSTNGVTNEKLAYDEVTEDNGVNKNILARMKSCIKACAENGDGILNIKAENEGLDSELHLTINGGIINITSGNDGINTNEDNVSVTTINGGTLNIICNGSTGEGDGIDSNGWLVINGGTVNAQACATNGDAGIDSDKGIYINGGTVAASGNMLDRIAGGEQIYAVFNFANRQQGGNVYSLKNADGSVVCEYAPKNDFTYLIVAGDDITEGDYTFWQGDVQLSASDSGIMQGDRPEMPEDFSMPEGDRQQFPGNINDVENFSRPDNMNEGRPPLQNGEQYQMPEGEQPPGIQQGERPEIPEGAENMTPPDNFGGMYGDNMPAGEPSATFTITKGSNQFFNVTSVTKQEY